MRRLVVLVQVLVAIFLSAASRAADPEAFPAYEEIRFPSLDRGQTDGAPVQLPGFLFRPALDGPRPAVVMMHGCGGLINTRGSMNAREADYAARLAKAGYVVLVVDSFTPRGVRNMCAPASYRSEVALARPKDAYGALIFLQGKPFVRPDRIGLIGWSQGGGAVLMTIRVHDSQGRPVELPHGDFRAAIAFYPGACSERILKSGWETKIPFLVLMGEQDVWTPLEPCRSLLDHAIARGSPVELHTYAGAYHDFDFPGVKLHEEPGYRTSAGVVPIVGMDPAAREDALVRVAAFLGRYLLD
jgi:dienelactone hydrolase